MIVSLVRFTPGAHTNWHHHAVGQTLYVIAGIGLAGSRDGTVSACGRGHRLHTARRGTLARLHQQHLRVSISPCSTAYRAATPPRGSNPSPPSGIRPRTSTNSASVSEFHRFHDTPALADLRSERGPAAA
jgi:hypothetical protein